MTVERSATELYDMIAIPGGTFRMGSDKHYSEEADRQLVGRYRNGGFPREEAKKLTFALIDRDRVACRRESVRSSSV
ncbi:hypothetical protein [Mesorhizobium sp. KR9-304]|uniref:hypothetical protein n=1 Tax=Mesorhizobium sp. KR9-304 TaxID=3156614 RepID=UPI0032B4695C